MTSHPPTEPTFDRLLQNGYRFEPIQYLKDGFALFKQFVGGFVLFTLAVLLGLRIAEELPELLGVAIQLCFAVCWAGYFFVCYKISHYIKPQMSDFLQGFRLWRLLLPVGIVSLCPLIVGLLVAIYTPAPVGLAAIAFALLLVVLFIFALPIVVFYQIPILQALSLSTRLVLKNALSVGFFFLLLMAINLLAIPTIIGPPLTIPLSACAIYSAFAHLVAQQSK